MTALRRLALAAAFVCTAPFAALAQPFEFVAFGDMPYSIPKDYPAFENVLAAINKTRPAFSFFIGDTKSGSSPCTDENIRKVHDYFNTLEQPLVYSVGDNEWTDCHRPRAGGYDTNERLAFVRQLHFSEPMSLGKSKMPVVRQPDAMPEFKLYVENSRWVRNNVLFVSVHIPGSNNNFERGIEQVQEYFARNKANLAWISAAFDLAERDNHAAIVFGFQADMWFAPSQEYELSSGYRETLALFTERGQKFAKPVLLVQGDSHVLKIDQPLKRQPEGKATLQNVYRLQVMGAGETHAVRIMVDPADPAVFGFRPLIVPENLPKPN